MSLIEETEGKMDTVYVIFSGNVLAQNLDFFRKGAPMDDIFLGLGLYTHFVRLTSDPEKAFQSFVRRCGQIHGLKSVKEIQLSPAHRIKNKCYLVQTGNDTYWVLHIRKETVYGY